MSLEARDIAFRYPRRGQRPVLTGVSITLAAGARSVERISFIASLERK